MATTGARGAAPATTGTTAPATASPASAAHDVQTPPQQDETIRHVAEILAVGAAAALTAQSLSTLSPGIPSLAWLLALRLAERGTAAKPRVPRSIELPSQRTSVAAEQARQELYFRAAYVLAAARRIGHDLLAGKSPRQAVAREARFAKMHEFARKQRLSAAAQVGRAASLYGPTLGWYTWIDGSTTPECLAADGANFDAAQRPLIGWPGSVHPRCRCRPGPPHPTSRTVDGTILREARAGRLRFKAA